MVGRTILAAALMASFGAGGVVFAQQRVAVPEGTPLVVGPGTQGFTSYAGPADTDFFWICDFDPFGNPTPIGEVAEDVHMKVDGDLASFTFRYFTLGAPPTGTTTAIINVYLNDSTDSVLPRCGLIATYTVPGLPYSPDLTLFEQTFDVPTPIPVPKDIWVGVEILTPPGAAGSLSGNGAFGGDPTVRYGASHNVEWFGGSCGLVPPDGLLIDNILDADFVGAAVIANHNLRVRVFPSENCPSPVPNGSFEGSPAFVSWLVTGTRWILPGFDAQTAPTSGAFLARLDTNGVIASSLASFLGVSVSTLDSLSSGTPVGTGSAMKQTISVAAGDTLSFDWNFATNEPTPNPTRNDFGFVTFSVGGSSMLADTLFSPFFPMQAGSSFSGGTFLEETGFQQYARTFMSPATVTLGLGSANQGSTANQRSALMIDCVQLTHGTGPNRAPTCTADLTAANQDFLVHASSGYIVTEGETIVVPFTGTDADGGLLMVTAAGLPPGASIGPTSGNSPLVSTFTWTPTAAEKANAPYLVSVTFKDATGAGSTCYLVICDVNLRPICTASDQTVECVDHSGTEVTLDGSATDPDDPASSLTFGWFVSDASVTLDDASSPTPTGTFPIGVTMATLTVADGRGGVDVCDVLITVQDTVPPEVMCSTDVAALWPPNHGMVPVTLVVTATDECSDPDDILPITVTVRSSEPDDAQGGGDGNTGGDVNGLDGYTTPVNVTSGFTYDSLNGRWTGTVLLRAERQGSGNGRKYTIDVIANDSHGNAANTSCVVVVPHDRRARS